MKNKALLWGVFIFTSLALAQSGWWRTYGGADNDWGNSVQQTSDGGYIVTGWTKSFGAGSYDVYLIKTDATGDTLWTRTYGGTSLDWSSSVRQTSDGGYIIAGYTSSFGAGYFDVYLIKTDPSGDTLWTRTFGDTNHDVGYSVQQTSDGGYIIAGSTQPFDTLWTGTHGGRDFDVVHSVQQTSDSCCIEAGFTDSFGAGSADVYLIKTNASGDTVWTRTYGGTSDDYGSSVQQTSDGGYIVVADTGFFGAGSRDVYLVRTNANGDTLWTRTYGGMGDDLGQSVQQTSDGGYIITGSTVSFSTGHSDVYLIKTGANGDTLWTRTYGDTNDDGGSSVRQASDGGYIIAGNTYSFGAGDADVFLIKTDANGNVGVEESCVRHLPNSSPQLLVQPNPFSSFARVPGHEGERFVLSDITGRHVGVNDGNRIGEGLGPGVYFLSPAVDKGHFPVRPVRIVKAASR